MRDILRIYIHTAATPGKSIDIGAREIRQYHVNTKGWDDIGYNAVCRFDGTIEPGRPEEKVPAGVQGDNSHTLHLCFSGNGDLEPLTPEQWESGVNWVANAVLRTGNYDRFMRNPKIILGHRECGDVPGVPKTTKTCPGKKVDCREFRLAVMKEVERLAE